MHFLSGMYNHPFILNIGMVMCIIVSNPAHSQVGIGYKDVVYGQVDGKELAEQASPVFHVGLNDPPLFIFHGDQDNQKPNNQAHELKGKYESFNLDVCFEVVYGAGHGGNKFFSGQNLIKAMSFFHKITN